MIELWHQHVRYVMSLADWYWGGFMPVVALCLSILASGFVVLLHQRDWRGWRSDPTFTDARPPSSGWIGSMIFICILAAVAVWVFMAAVVPILLFGWPAFVSLGCVVGLAWGLGSLLDWLPKRQPRMSKLERLEQLEKEYKELLASVGGGEE